MIYQPAVAAAAGGDVRHVGVLVAGTYWLGQSHYCHASQHCTATKWKQTADHFSAPGRSTGRLSACLDNNSQTKCPLT